jgi:hypothetical protein
MIEIAIMLCCILIIFLLLGIFDELLDIRDLLILEVLEDEGDLRDN